MNALWGTESITKPILPSRRTAVDYFAAQVVSRSCSMRNTTSPSKKSVGHNGSHGYRRCHTVGWWTCEAVFECVAILKKGPRDQRAASRIAGSNKVEQLDLDAGEIECAVTSGIGNFSVQTSIGTVSVNGTRFSVQLVQTKENEVVEKKMMDRVLAGALLVANRGVAVKKQLPRIPTFSLCGASARVRLTHPTFSQPAL